MVPQSPNMVSAPDVVDISSDEEDCGFGWISDLLDGVGEESEGFDDVMVVDDLSAPPVVLPRRNPKSGRSRKGGEREGSDDECQVLDSDPSNPVSVVDDGRGSDELLIVGEKGPVMIPLHLLGYNSLFLCFTIVFLVDLCLNHGVLCVACLDLVILLLCICFRR